MRVTRDEVINLIRSLPEDKLESARDYLSFLYYAYGTSEAQMQAEDADWEGAFASNPEKHRALAREAQEDYLTGRTTLLTEYLALDARLRGQDNASFWKT